MRKTIVAGLIAGVVLYIWFFVAWVVLPHHNMVMEDLPDTHAILDFMKSQNLESGVYSMPSMSEMQASPEECTQRYKAGPIIPFMVYYADGRTPMSAGTMIMGLIYCFIAAWLAAELLQIAKPNLPGRGRQMLFILGFVLFAVLTVSLTQVNWFWYPFSYVLMDILDLVVGWTIAGWIISWWLGRTPKSEPLAVA